MKRIKGGITAVKGFLAAGVSCGLKKSGKPDLGLVQSIVPATAQCAYTRNLFAGPPVTWCKKVTKKGRRFRGVVVNSGIANAVTGTMGHRHAASMAALAAGALNCRNDEILVASTGVIGKQLPMEKVKKGIRQAGGTLSRTGGQRFSKAILTTDTVAKTCAVELNINNKPVRIGGCAKGSGMIQPDMATMLAFIATDAHVPKKALAKAFKQALALSFNRITVDGDTSTNDTVMLLANGMAGNRAICPGTAFSRFTLGLAHVFGELAKMIVRDGEGATKLVTVKVTKAAAESHAETIARAIANSPLVKTALFGNDPNWGRILAAAGSAGIRFNPARCSLTLCNKKLIHLGQPIKFNEKAVSNLLKRKEIEIILTINTGKKEAEIYTCDFSYEYVKINAEYHT